MGRRGLRSALGATLLYAGAAVAVTWPLLPRAARDVPGDLLDPLFTCWALGWNFRAFGLSDEGPTPASYWDANIFHPTPMALARSEHFLPQALFGAPVYALTHDLVLTYNVLFLGTFVLSGLFFFLLARDETGDEGAALGAGLLFAFALFRWAQIEHLGALSSQWMPLALLLARRVAREARPGPAAAWIGALGVTTAVQVLSSGYYLLFFPPFLALWAAVEAARARGIGPWLRLAAAGSVAALLALPMVLPYVALRSGGADRDIASVMAHSADLLSFVTAPEISTVWGPLLDAFPRGEARLFPGLVTPLLAVAGLLAGLRSARGGIATADHPGELPRRVQKATRIAAFLLAAAAALGGLLTVAGGSVSVGSLHVRAMTPTRPALLLTLALFAAVAGWGHLNRLVRAVLARREVVAVLLCVLAAWLATGPVVTLRGWPVPLPAPYRWLYEYAPGFGAGRAPARFAMIAACFGALAAAWGLRHLRASAAGRRAAWLLCGAFLLETAAVPLPLSRQWDVEGVAALPAWNGGASAIVTAIRALPDDAVLAVLPFGEIFHDTRAMFDSAHHGRRLLNGYSSWTPDAHTRLALAARDPLRHAPEVVAALRAAGATHVVVHEAAWMHEKGTRVTERLVDASARPVARVGDVVLLVLH